MLKHNASEQEKCLAIAGLMAWEKPHYAKDGHIALGGSCMQLHPYRECSDGLAQFASILLAFPEVLRNWDWHHRYRPLAIEWGTAREATQANILNEILRIKGVMK